MSFFLALIPSSSEVLMMRNAAKSVPVILVLSVIGIMSFAATAFAGGAAGVPQDASALDLLQPVWAAFTHGNYLYAGCLTVILGVAVIRKYGDSWKWVHTDMGAAILVFAGSMAATLGTSAAAGTISLAMVWAAVKIAAGASGGYTLLKHLVVEPLLKPLRAKFPALAPVLDLVLWVFDRPAATAEQVKKAETAGQAAVEAKPSQGVTAVLGQPLEVE